MPGHDQVTTLFFDLGATLVDPVFGPDGKLTGFTAFPGAKAGLQRLAESRLRLGIISDTGDVDVGLIRTALAANGLLDFFAPELVLFSGEVNLDKSTRAIFRLAKARDRALATPSLCRYVGEDPAERRTARSAGMRTSRSLEAALGTVEEVRVDLPNLSNSRGVRRGCRDAGLDGTAGPPEPHDYNQLLGRLEAAKMSLPPIYRQGIAEPFIAVLRNEASQASTRSCSATHGVRAPLG